MYTMIKETISDDLLGCYETYGIESKEAGIRVSDVSLDCEKLAVFIMRINRGRLSPVHLLDVIEDSLNEFV